MTKKPPLKQRLKALFKEYGLIAILTHASISIITIGSFAIAIWFGLSPSTSIGTAGAIAGGWAAAQPLLPLRTLATLALTPIIARVLRRRRAVTALPPPVAPDSQSSNAP